MARLKVLLYSKQKTQRILYDDQDGVMTTEIEQTFLRRCDVSLLRNGGARINVSEKTKTALNALQTKYDKASRYHIRKLLGFNGLSDYSEYRKIYDTSVIILYGDATEGTFVSGCNYKEKQNLGCENPKN